MLDLVDIDAPDTWPARLLAAVSGPGFDPAVHDWRGLLEGRRLLTYHATRLLPHEVDVIRAEGLQALTPGLLDRRIEEAHRLGYLTQDEVDIMRSSNVFSRNRAAGRVGIVCSFMGRTILRHQADVEGLLCCWGGEALHGHDPAIQRLACHLGVPSLVVLAHPTPADVTTNLFPDLVTAFRDAYTNPAGARGNVIHHGSVPADCVVEVIEAEPAVASGRFPELSWLRNGPCF